MTTDLRTPHFREIRDTLTGKRAFVYAAMQTHGPATPSELAARINWETTSVRPRATELRQAGLAETTGERRNSEYVLKAVPLALAEQRRSAGEFQLTSE